MLAPMGALALGPGPGRTLTKDGGGPTAPHDLDLAAIGAVGAAGVGQAVRVHPSEKGSDAR